MKKSIFILFWLCLSICENLYAQIVSRETALPVASGYLATDFTILLFTGSTIGQKLDNKYGSYIIR